MRCSNTGRRAARSAFPGIALAVAVAAVVSILPLSQALADNDGRHGNDSRGRRGPPPRMSRYHHYPVYAPPPVYYPRDDSPGIRLIFPIDIH